MRTATIAGTSSVTLLRTVQSVSISWLLVIGVDFFFHAGVLAWVWERPSPFLLPAQDLALRIPLGYAAFLLHVVLVVWLMQRLGVRTPKAGALFGAKLGALVAVSGVLAMASVSTISTLLTVVWAVTTVAYFVAAGYAGAAALGAVRLRPLVLQTIAATVGLIVVGIIAQNVVPSI